MDTSSPRYLLSADEASRALALGKTKFYELVREGAVPAPAHVGRRAVWSADEIKVAADRILERGRK